MNYSIFYLQKYYNAECQKKVNKGQKLKNTRLLGWSIFFLVYAFIYVGEKLGDHFLLVGMGMVKLLKDDSKAARDDS